MKIFYVLVLVTIISTAGCVQRQYFTSAPAIEQFSGIYSGNYTIKQNDYRPTEGYVTIQFDPATYSQKITTYYSPTDTLETFGKYEICENSLYFNKGEELSATAWPVWYLLGKFSAEINGNVLTLHYKDHFTDYIINMVKIK